MQKIASINFYNDENLQEKGLKLKIDNILFFREALVKRMSTLKVKVEAKKLIKGQLQEKRLTNREINTMNINQIVQNVNLLKQKIDNNELNYYNVNTLTTLCGKAIEYYSAINDDSHIIYLNIMKSILQRDDVQKITSEDK
jgi:pantothenate kinase